MHLLVSRATSIHILCVGGGGSDSKKLRVGKQRLVYKHTAQKTVFDQRALFTVNDWCFYRLFYSAVNVLLILSSAEFKN